MYIYIYTAPSYSTLYIYIYSAQTTISSNRHKARGLSGRKIYGYIFFIQGFLSRHLQFKGQQG